jgi:Tfp pilus assembly protein PilF
MRSKRITIAAMLLASLLAACSTTPSKEVAPPPPQLIEPAARKAAAVEPAASAPLAKTTAAADAALTDGLKFYQGGQYRLAETQLKTALKNGLSVPVDVANAHKHLAFIYCTSKRDKACVAAFKSAKAADPGFALSKAEAGHPMWSKAYKKALGLK